MRFALVAVTTSFYKNASDFFRGIFVKNIAEVLNQIRLEISKT